jgi:thiamine pyrophosphokinase
MKKTAAILCNGTVPKKSIYKKFDKKYNFDLICADGGANTAFEFGLLPKVIIGDLDSINIRVLKHYQQKGVKIHKLSRQNDTDFEKALKLAVKLKITRVIIFGFSGKRFDQTLSNISNAMKYSKQLDIFLVEDRSILQFISNEGNFDSIKGEVVSLICFDKKTKITTRNLRFPLKNESLQFGKKESISNQSTGNQFSITVKNGVALLTRDLKAYLQVN